MAVSFANDIAPMFKLFDVNMAWRFGLTTYDDVKANGGNLPAREDVRLAVSQGANPRFDANGDTRERIFTILKALGQPAAWAPGDEVRV